MNETKQQNHTHPVLSSLPPQRAKKGKIVSADEAVRVIRDGDTVATGGFVGTGFPEEIAVALEHFYLRHKRPRDLTLVYAAGQGDGAERGVEPLRARRSRAKGDRRSLGAGAQIAENGH